LTRIFGQKSLKFVAISAAASFDCDQTLRTFTAILDTTDDPDRRVGAANGSCR
jgi:hypothetical protein